MKLALVLIIASASIVGLSACGGSGNSAGNLPVVSLLIIDSGNAGKIAGAASGAALVTAEIGGLTDLTGSTVAVSGGVGKSDPIAAATKIAQSALGGGVVGYVPIPPTTSPCAVSGSVTVSGDLASLTTFTAGDVITVDSDMCDDGTGQVVDGLLKMTITSFEGDILTSEFLFGVDLVVTDFMVTENGETTTANGNVGTSIDTRTPPVAEGSVFGDSFTVSGMGITESITSFSTIYTEDSSAFPVAWTINSMGTVDSSDFTGAVKYETPVTFQGSGENYPYTGQLLVTGANNGTLLLTVVDDGVTQVEVDYDVRIEADYDGDGTIDETLYMTWIELEG